MRRAARMLAAAALLLGGCAALPPPQSEDLAASDAALRGCAEWERDLDAAIDPRGCPAIPT